MKQTITLTFRASEGGLQEKLKDYYSQGWKLVSKEKGSWWGKIGNTYNYRVILEREDKASTEDNDFDKLLKLKELKDSGGLSEEEYEIAKKKILMRL